MTPKRITAGITTTPRISVWILYSRYCFGNGKDPHYRDANICRYTKYHNIVKSMVAASGMAEDLHINIAYRVNLAEVLIRRRVSAAP